MFDEMPEHMTWNMRHNWAHQEITGSTDSPTIVAVIDDAVTVPQSIMTIADHVHGLLAVDGRYANPSRGSSQALHCRDMHA